MKKCVLAYSGGLDTSVMIPWLIDQEYEVHCIMANVGQDEDQEMIVKRAFELGAKSCEVVDCHKDLSEVFKYACLLNSKYEGQYFLGTAFTRPFIAKAQIDKANAIGATTLVHGATGKGNDQIRFEYAYKTLGANLEIIAPWKFWEFDSRKSLITYLESKGFDYGFSEKKDYSIDRNVWHTSIEGSDLEVPNKLINITEILADNDYKIGARNDLEFEVSYNAGVLKINSEELSFFEAVKYLNDKCGLQDWAIDLLVENRQTGIKSRGIYITPGAKVLYKAFEALAQSGLNKNVYNLFLNLGKDYADALYNGEYFSLQYKTITAAVDSLIGQLEGSVVIKTTPFLYVAKIDHKKPLFKEEICTFEGGEISHADAEGFINLSWLSADGGGHE